MKSKGFTLIEILIAVAILATMASISITTIWYVSNSHDQIKARMKVVQHRQIALALIDRDLEQIMARPIINEFDLPESSVLYDKEKQRLSLTRTGYINPLDQSKSRFVRVAYEHRDEQLIRIQYDHLDRLEEGQFQERVLFDDVIDVNWGFLDEESKLYDIWPIRYTLKDPLPIAIIMNLSLKGGDMEHWYILASHDAFFLGADDEP